MIKSVVLCHPSSKNILRDSVFRSKIVDKVKISCGVSRTKYSDFCEGNDFNPTYAAWNSCLFESSVIMTVWEHADTLIGNDDVAILHTDVQPHFTPYKMWRKISSSIKDGNIVGLTIPYAYMGAVDDWIMPENIALDVRNDPMLKHAFDIGINVWDFIKKYDYDIYSYALDENPCIVFSHQFACSRKHFDELGYKLSKIIRNLRLQDTGFWTPHMFERLIGLYLSKISSVELTTAFWHHSSSGTFGPGENILYGPKGVKFYRTRMRLLDD